MDSYTQVKLIRKGDLTAEALSKLWRVKLVLCNEIVMRSHTLLE